MGSWLLDDERALLEAWRRSALRVYDVALVQGSKLTLQAVPDGVCGRCPTASSWC